MSAAAIEAISTPPSQKVTQKSWLTALALFSADCVALLLAVTLALFVYVVWGHSWLDLAASLKPAISAVVIFAALGLYPVVVLNPAQEFRRVVIGSSAAYGLVLGAAAVRQTATIPLGFAAVLAWGASIVLVMMLRTTLRGVCARMSWWGVPTIVFGSGPTAKSIVRTLESNPSLGLKVVGVFAENSYAWQESARSAIQFGPPEMAPAFAQSCGVCHAIVAMPNLSGKPLQAFVKGYARPFKHVLIIPDLDGLSSVWVEPRDVGGVLGLEVKQTLMHQGPQVVKRAIDILCVGVALVLFAPLIAALYLAVRLSSSGPGLYGQLRVGRGNTMFRAWKFRSMFADADEVLERHLESDPGLRQEWLRDHKLKNDPRVTPVGRFLRKTSLDELPQLFNVLQGDMSLVGPRPIVPAEAGRYGEHFDAYQSVRPGITGLWQVSGRNNTTYDERVGFDEYYVRNWSIWLDLYVLGKTVKVVLLREGAY